MGRPRKTRFSEIKVTFLKSKKTVSQLRSFKKTVNHKSDNLALFSKYKGDIKAKMQNKV